MTVPAVSAREQTAEKKARAAELAWGEANRRLLAAEAEVEQLREERDEAVAGWQEAEHPFNASEQRAAIARAEAAEAAVKRQKVEKHKFRVENEFMKHERSRLKGRLAAAEAVVEQQTAALEELGRFFRFVSESSYRNEFSVTVNEAEEAHFVEVFRAAEAALDSLAALRAGAE